MIAALRPSRLWRAAPARVALRRAARALSSGGGAPRPALDDEPDFGLDLVEEHPAVMRRIDAVRALHERHTALSNELADKVEALTLEYDAKLAPFLARRADIVSGRSEPTPDEAKPLEEYLGGLSAPAGEAEPGIPGFWLTAITEHEALADSVTEADAPVLEYLQDVQCLKFRAGERAHAQLAVGEAEGGGGGKKQRLRPEVVDEMPGFELVFTFAPNPYFDETVLRKLVWMEDGYPAATLASPIRWRAGKDVTHRVRRGRRTAPPAAHTRRCCRRACLTPLPCPPCRVVAVPSQTVVKHSKRQNRKVKALEPVPSFFHFFESRVFEFDEADFAPGPSSRPGVGSGAGGGADAAESELDRHMEDLRMTLTFRDELVPNAAEYAAIVVDDEEDEEEAR